METLAKILTRRYNRYMGTLQELLIKRAGMEKVAINAVSLRNLVANLSPEEAIKRFGKKRVARINEEIENAANRYASDEKSVNPDYISVIGQKRLNLPFRPDSKRLERIPEIDRMAKNVPIAEQDYRDGLAREYRRDFKNLFFDRTKFTTREQLLRDAKRYGVELNPRDLKNDVYHHVLRDPLDSAAKAGTTAADVIRINAQLPHTVGHLTSRLNTAIAGAVRDPLVNNIITTHKLRFAPERSSIRRALDIVRNQNVLEPGTRANRLYKRVVHGAKSSKRLNYILQDVFDGGLFSDPKQIQQAIEKGDNAFFHPLTNSIFVAPTGRHSGKNTLLHESSHMRWHNLSPEKRLETARHYLSNLQRSAIRHKLNIPWDDPRLMNEYLADAAEPALNTLGFRNILKRPTLSISNAIPAARINLLDAPDDVRRGLLQLQMNYDHPVFKA